MKYFAYEVSNDTPQIREMKINSDLENGKAILDKDTLKISFIDFDKSFDHWLPKSYIESFLRISFEKFPERKRAAIGS